MSQKCKGGGGSGAWVQWENLIQSEANLVQLFIQGLKNRKQILLRSPTNNCAKYQHPKKDEIFLKNNKIVFFTFLKVYKNEPFKEIFFSFVKTKKFAKPFVHMVEGRIFKAKKLVENLVTLSLYISDTFKCTQLEIQLNVLVNCEICWQEKEKGEIFMVRRDI